MEMQKKKNVFGQIASDYHSLQRRAALHLLADPAQLSQPQDGCLSFAFTFELGFSTSLVLSFISWVNIKSSACVHCM